MNIDYYLKKKHIFKNRKYTDLKPSFKLDAQNISIYTLQKYRLEFVYMRLFKKLLRRKFIKSTTRFFKPKYWIYLKPNYILTQKSKNSRMGAGVGNFVRLTHITSPGKAIIKTFLYKKNTLTRLIQYLRYKLKGNFLLKTYVSSFY